MPARTSRTGRPGALEEARELVTLVSSLSEAGDALSVEAVASRLGVSQERAERLVELVLTTHVVGGTGLPLIVESDGVTLLISGGVRGRRLRLSRSETLAVAAALERLGVPKDDPLRAKMEASLSGGAVDEALVGRLVAERAPGSGEVAVALSACARAMARQAALSFSYRKVPAAEGEPRRAEPRALRFEDGAWYLDALDLDRQGARTFRLDRMSDVEQASRPSADVTELERAQKKGEKDGRVVRLSFSDPSYLDLLPWHDLRVTATQADGAVVAETPWYGGSWLPKMVCACAGTVTTDNPDLTAAVRRLAQDLLASA